jgi:hypothetical protein
MRASVLTASSLITIAALLAGPAVADPRPTSGAVTEFFDTDPLSSTDIVLDGEVLERLTWNDDEPVFPGDRAGSLTAVYDSRLPAGRIGWPLSEAWSAEDAFTVTAVFVIESEGFTADPFGFFQISWGLWNSATTGLERTGSFSDFASDTFELIEFAWFPNVSPFFGGPYLSPSIFGVAAPDHPSYDFLGAFANFAFGSVPLDLPLDEPLAAVLEHRPSDGVMVVSVHRINERGRRVPLPGAVAVVTLDDLARRDLSVDTVGLTLWHDGFGGDPPSLRADVIFHAMVAAQATVARP